MSLLVRAAVLGSLAYALSRALKARRNTSQSNYLPRADAPRVAHTPGRDEARPTAEFSSTSRF